MTVDFDPPMLLGPAIHTGLRALIDLRWPPAALTDGRIETLLYSALEGADGAGPSAAAVRAAAAHLGAGEYEDAYLALRTALDYLPRPPRRDG